MQRLTKRMHGVRGFALLSDAIDGKYPAEKIIDLLANKLADYEDLGYDPVEIRALAASHIALKAEAMPLLCAKAQGKVIMTPGVGELLYETDPEHGVVTHRVDSVHWMVNTTATDKGGCEWADFWTDDDIEDAFTQVSDAQKKVEEIQNAVL